MIDNLRITTTHMVCPVCLEALLREDVEGFGRCPYCDHAFDLSPAVENFLLTPVIQHWVHHTQTQIQNENHFAD